jgi:hypothetical protein
MDGRQTRFVVAEGRSYEAPARGIHIANRKHAVLIVHGMGQQSTFGTVASLADAVLHATSSPPRDVVARDVQIGEERLGRIELTLRDEYDESHEVHFYEAYWAPLTEGRVTLRDVMRFLVITGLGAFRASLRGTFPRWAFGAVQRYPVKHATPVVLLLAMLLLAALFAISAVMIVAGVASLAVSRRFPVDEGTLAQLSGIAAALALLVLTLFATLNCAARSRSVLAVKRVRAWFAAAGWAHVALIGAAIPASAWLMLRAVRGGVAAGGISGRALHALGQGSDQLLTLAMGNLLAILVSFFLRRDGGTIVWGYVTIAWSLYVTAALGALLLGATAAPPLAILGGLRWGWWFLLGAALVVRQVLVQYAGDVAAYVTPQSLDRFNDLREEIKACVHKTGSAIYRATRDGAREYDQITVAGHSLGSVAAYDMLNRLLRDDAAGVTELDVEARTRALVTFGSPLDKIAFLFGMRHPNHAAHALAGTVQPLLQSRVRRFEWINIHSSHDVVSGPLEYFDDLHPQPAALAVINERDETASTPLVAHVEYWTGGHLARRILGLATSRRKNPPMTLVSGGESEGRG